MNKVNILGRFYFYGKYSRLDILKETEQQFSSIFYSLKTKLPVNRIEWPTNHKECFHSIRSGRLLLLQGGQIQSSECYKSTCCLDYYLCTEILIFFLKIYLFIYDRQKEGGRAETQAEGEAGSTPGAPCGTWPWGSRIVPWAKGRHQTAEPPRDPQILIF